MDISNYDSFHGGSGFSHAYVIMHKYFVKTKNVKNQYISFNIQLKCFLTWKFHAILLTLSVATLALGLRPRQGFARLRAKKKVRESSAPENWPNLLACRWHVTYRWKALNEGYNFALNLITIGGLHEKLSNPKVTEVPTIGISGLPFASLGTKCHLDLALVERCIIYYKGEGGGFPQVQAVVSLVSLRLLVAHPSTESAQTMHEPTCCLVCANPCEWLNACHSS